ncbi:MAG: fumarylacetoacetate hydrolase family protein [Actinomycetota bacterium]|nr:fumarylacetoacetate hydrolase family protein [Actinomycetota bacterium]
MRLVTFRTDHGTRAGRIDGDEVVELDAPDVGALLGEPDGLARAGRATGTTRALAGLDLAPVVPRPPKIACVGRNYAEHAAELGNAVPEAPTWFAKFTSALTGPVDPILLPDADVSTSTDWEVELAVIIGRRARRIRPDAALDVVAGYCVASDVSVRDWQRRTSQFLAGKTFDRTCPLGPALVTTDEIGDGRGLAIGCEVDGVEMQRATTDAMVFGVADLVADLSVATTLEPGDVILTGTPSGVGAGRTPPVFLRPGQTLRSWVERVGELVNVCEQAGG